MNAPNDQPTGYAPPPPTLPAIQADPPPPPALRTSEEPPKVEPPPEEPCVEVSPDAALNEWIISILRDAVTYPTRKHGWSILIPGAALAVALPILAMAGVLGLIACICILGYFAAYYLDIIGTSVSGETALPDWPIVSDFTEDVIGPALKMIGVALISSTPSIIYAFTQDHYKTEGFIGSLLYLISAGYFPMACIAIAMTDSLATALPHRVIPAITRCLPEYLVPVFILIVVKVITVLIEGIALFILPAFVSAIIIALVTFYGLIIQARITGLTCQRFRNRIQWG